MRRAVLALPLTPTRLLVDGNRLPCLGGLGEALTARAIVGGDASEPSISAASILAKTVRDAIYESDGYDLPSIRVRKSQGLRHA